MIRDKEIKEIRKIINKTCPCRTIYRDNLATAIYDYIHKPTQAEPKALPEVEIGVTGFMTPEEQEYNRGHTDGWNKCRDKIKQKMR